MSEQNHANPQSERNRIYEIIHEINQTPADGDYIYRGEPERFEKVSSTLYRQLEKARVEAPGDMVEEVQSAELERARRFTDKTDEIEILTELQHFGGKTNLIDFTTDSYLALFFACYGPDSLEKDGRVILQDRNGAVKGWIRKPHNPGPGSRVDAQKSIFVKPPEGVVVPDKEVVIPKDLKQPILTFLATQESPISLESVYHDLHGFIRSQEIRWGNWTEFGKAETWQSKGDATDNLEEKREYYQKAAGHFTRAIKRQPDFAEAYYNRGLVHHKNDKVDLAIDDYNKVIELKPRFTAAYNNRGLAYYDKNELDLAIQDYDTAISINPHDVFAYNNRGNAYTATGQHDRAIGDFDAAISVNPRDATTYCNRGRTYVRKSEFDKAIEDFSKAIRLEPDDAVNYLNRGKTYRLLDRLDLAIEDYTTALLLKPNHVDAHNSRGVVYSSKGEHELAIADYNKAIELNPDFAGAYYNRGTGYVATGEFDKAIEDLSKAIELEPNSVDAHVNRGKAYQKKAEFDKAIQNYNTAIRLDPAPADTYYKRAVARLHLKEWDEVELDLGLARNKGLNIIATFRKEHESVAAFEQRTGIQMPESIKALLTDG